MTVYVVYIDYGYGERSAPRAVFTSYEKAEAFIKTHDSADFSEIEPLELQ